VDDHSADGADVAVDEAQVSISHTGYSEHPKS
jgi:hypothetical protein